MTQSTLRELPVRSYMMAFKGVTAILPFRWPQVLEGEGSLADLASHLQQQGFNRVLLVTDTAITQLGLLQPFVGSCAQLGINVDIFDAVKPDPTFAIIEAGTELAKREKCQAVVAIGGGSVIDAAKLIGACALTDRPLRKMAGLFKVRKGMLPLFAVPTTAGTGSEATIAAVVTDPEAQQKLTVLDLKLMPTMAVLDPLLTVNLPAPITAATGMDALTHAVEAYLSRNALMRTDELALKAARLINTWLPKAYACDGHLEARSHMAKAAMLAGQAFTQAGVGYIHAIAHNLGARYQVPHGLANAIVMPHLLRFSLSHSAVRMAQLARVMGLSAQNGHQDDAAMAAALVERVEQLNERFAIPTYVEQLVVEDIPAIVKAARAEARFTYAVPRYMSQAEGEQLLKALLPPSP